MKVLIIDNYDSFVYNLVQLIGSLNTETYVYRNNEIKSDDIKKINPDRIVISPGPGNPKNPRDFGICSSILRNESKYIPTLGVCLGNQGIIHSYGGKIKKATIIKHGKTSLIKHDKKGIYKNIDNPFLATRYHSLVGDKITIPKCLEITAISLDDEEIMGVRHIKYPIEGVQFHPESILTKVGTEILKNFLGV